ncbi:hypothetical protein CONCODRAFT_73240 [Conidiobolus coronatus NRRL 28638]|uniref:Uncharacterized protein n=1 Tax=Conidiobolus coronatus (strain ATCC 28846 / CBS 209.66 / NRRL 28638) TaxID=796925 RepID=A0A137NWK6_CONC2|nr:hypothetical protein CONCODRAFT_73240 [Conidiobolus coronatus NRRL 28638]|eukprot:KXN67068.1 hypothetical protein CONCODRAFT_73240 [Conidiobolus coronatus NRRL 28638]
MGPKKSDSKSTPAEGSQGSGTDVCSRMKYYACKVTGSIQKLKPSSVKRIQPSPSSIVDPINIIRSSTTRTTRSQVQSVPKDPNLYIDNPSLLVNVSSIAVSEHEPSIRSEVSATSSVPKKNSAGEPILWAAETVKAPKKPVKKRRDGHISSVTFLKEESRALRVGDMLVDRVAWPSISEDDEAFFLDSPNITLENLLIHLKVPEASWEFTFGVPRLDVNDCANWEQLVRAELNNFSQTRSDTLGPLDYTSHSYFRNSIKLPKVAFPQLTSNGLRISSLSCTPSINHPLTKFFINEAILVLLPFILSDDGEVDFDGTKFTVPYNYFMDGTIGDHSFHFLPIDEDSVQTVDVPRTFLENHNFLDNLMILSYCMTFLKGGLGSGNYSKGLRVSSTIDIFETGTLDELGILFSNKLQDYAGVNEFDEQQGYINLMGSKLVYKEMTNLDFARYVFHKPSNCYSNMAHCGYYSIPRERSGGKLCALGEELFARLSQLTKKDSISRSGYRNIKDILNFNISLEDAENNLILKWLERLAGSNSIGYTSTIDFLPYSIVWYRLYQSTYDSETANLSGTEYMLKGLKRIYVLAQCHIRLSDLNRKNESLGKAFLEQCRGWEEGCQHHPEFRIPKTIFENASCLTMADLAKQTVNTLSFKSDASQFNHIMSWTIRYALLYEHFGVGVFTSNFGIKPTSLELIPWRVFKPFIIQASAYAHFPDLGIAQPVPKPLAYFFKYDEFRNCVSELGLKALCAARYQVINNYNVCGPSRWTKDLLNKFIASYYIRDVEGCVSIGPHLLIEMGS